MELCVNSLIKANPFQTSSFSIVNSKRECYSYPIPSFLKGNSYSSKLTWNLSNFQCIGSSKRWTPPSAGLDSDDKEIEKSNNDSDFEFPLMDLPWNSPSGDTSNTPFDLEAFYANSINNTPEENSDTQSVLEPGYVPLFVKTLGMDHPIEEREEALLSLWSHSQNGKDQINEIASVPGGINLIVSLLQCDRTKAAEAAAGLLRSISSMDEWRNAVVEAGAVEEVAGLLRRKTSTSKVREQAAAVLWNVTIEEKEMKHVASPEIIQQLISMLESGNSREGEAAAGVIANLSLSQSNWPILFRCGVIPAFAKLVMAEEGITKITRQEARGALVEMSRDESIRSSIMEEGLIIVPLIGAEAYSSFQHSLESPSLPKEIVKKVNLSPPKESPFGANRFLIGLSLPKEGEEVEIDEETVRMIEGRVRQKFLARLGLLEKDKKFTDVSAPSITKRSEYVSQMTVMPRWDGIPRLILILSLENAQVAAKAANASADFATSEVNRIALRDAGAIPPLIRLLKSELSFAIEASANALSKLSPSASVRKTIETQNGLEALVFALKFAHISPNAKEKVVATLLLMSKDEGETDSLVQAGAISGLIEMMNEEEMTSEGRMEAEDILEEISSLNYDPRLRIIAAGGLLPLIHILNSSCLKEREKGSQILLHLAQEEANALAMVANGALTSLASVFKLPDPLGLDVPISSTENEEDIWQTQKSFAKLIARLSSFQTLKPILSSSELPPLLSSFLNSNAPLPVKTAVSEALMNMNTGVARELIICNDTIPKLVNSLLQETGNGNGNGNSNGGREAATATRGEEEGNAFNGSREEALFRLREILILQPGYGLAVAKAGGIFPLVHLLSNSSTYVRDAALAVLYSLSGNEENHPAIVAAGAVKALERIVREGSAKTEQWKLALYLLRCLP